MDDHDEEGIGHILRRTLERARGEVEDIGADVLARLKSVSKGSLASFQWQHAIY